MTRKTFAQLFFSTLLGVAALPSLAAATLQYKVSVNTSTFSATPGFIELQFNQANSATSLSGDALVTGFSASGLVADVSSTGGSAGVTGSFNSPPLHIPNDVGGANYFDQGVTKFGTAFSFLVTFTGPVAGGVAADPSGFYVFLLDTSYNSLVTTANASNEVANLILRKDGTVSAAGSAYAAVTVVTPEPATWALAGCLCLLMPILRRRK